MEDLNMRKKSLGKRENGSPRNRIFTLVELLIVVAIIAILAAMLLPALSKARDTSTTIACLSNLSSFNKAALLYADDFNGFCPPVWPGNTENQDAWFLNKQFYRISGVKYYGSWGFVPQKNLCPNINGVNIKPAEEWAEGYRYVFKSYVLNCYQGRYCGTGAGGAGDLPRAACLKLVKSPSKRYLFREGMGDVNTATNLNDAHNKYAANGWLANKHSAELISAVPYRHRSDDGHNIAFADGHAATKSASDIYANLQTKYRKLTEE